MVDEGLNVGLEDFKKMKVRDQNVIIFQNISHIRGNVRNDKLNRKIQYFWLVGLSVLMGIKRMFGL